MEKEEVRWGSITGSVVPAVTITLPGNKAQEFLTYLEEQKANVALAETVQWEVWAVLDDICSE